MTRNWCSRHGDCLRIAVQVQPNASASVVVGEIEGALKLKLKAPPVEGKANEALEKYLAKLFNVPKRDVSVTHGHTSRLKLLEIRTDLSVDEAKALLMAA